MLDMRIMVFDRLDSYLFDIDPMQVRNATYVTEIAGEHSITIETSQELEKTNRLLLRDGMGIWHEYVVLGIEETHDAKEYYCIWSLQYDLAGTFINGPYDCGIVPGHASVPQPPRRAMEVALGGTERWAIGTISVTSTGAASFYRRSGWEGLKTVLEKWGGELNASITVSTTGVVSRAVDLLAHVGSSDATRRFDYGHDLQSIKRTISDEIWPCRIVPLGKAQETENGGYTRRPDISSVNGGVMWLQDDSVVEETRILNPNGEYEYPTRIIENDTYEEPQEVKDWALAHLTEYTRPRVTYEANVVQLARAGLNAHGVALGDDIVVVDRTFGTDGLRITARVTKIAGSLLDPADTTLTIGNMAESLSNQFASMSRQVDQLTDTVERSQAFQASADYVSHLLGRINDEANATGGYTYITEGQGLRTYDTPVSDPLVGAEASQVVEIKGGTIRIANTRDSGGNWNWRTVVQSGLLVADTVKALDVNAGIIRSFDGGSYWDLDSNIFKMGFELTPVFTGATMSVSTSKTRSSKSGSVTKGRQYLVVFSTSGNPGPYARVALTSYSSIYSDRVPASIVYDAPTSRYAAVVTPTSTQSMYACIIYDVSQYDGRTFSCSDVCVYELPTDGDGVINFNAASEDELDEVDTTIMAGLMRVSNDALVTELSPGALVMSGNHDTPSSVQFSPDVLMYYNNLKHAFEFGNTVSSTHPVMSLDGSTTPNVLPGKLEKTGISSIAETDSDVCTAAYSATIVSRNGYRWGPLAFIRIVVTTLGSISPATNGIARRQFCTLASGWKVNGTTFIGTGTVAISSTEYIQATFYANNSTTIYMAGIPGMTNAIPAGSTITLNAVYLLA